MHCIENSWNTLYQITWSYKMKRFIYLLSFKRTEQKQFNQKVWMGPLKRSIFFWKLATTEKLLPDDKKWSWQFRVSLTCSNIVEGGFPSARACQTLPQTKNWLPIFCVNISTNQVWKNKTNLYVLLYGVLNKLVLNCYVCIAIFAYGKFAKQN